MVFSFEKNKDPRIVHSLHGWPADKFALLSIYANAKACKQRSRCAVPLPSAISAWGRRRP